MVPTSEKDAILSTLSAELSDLHKSDEEPVSLTILDLLVVAAGIWPILLLGPLVAGILAYFIIAAQPTSYVASANFAINTALTAPVLREMLDTDLGKKPARGVTVDPASQKAILTVGASTAEEARMGVVNALEALVRHPGLSPERMATVSDNLRQNQAQADTFQDLFDQIKSRIGTAVDTELGSQQANISDALTAFITIADKLAILRGNSADLQALLDSKLIDSPEQEIHVSTIQPAKLAPSVLMALIVGLGVYVLALMHHLWKQASKNPRFSPKVEQIRRSLRLKRRINQ